MRATIKIERESNEVNDANTVVYDETPLNFDLKKLEWFHIDLKSTDRDIIASIAKKEFRIKHDSKILTYLNSQLNRRT